MTNKHYQYKIEVLVTSDLDKNDLEQELLNNFIAMERRGALERDLTFFRVAENYINATVKRWKSKQ